MSFSIISLINSVFADNFAAEVECTLLKFNAKQMSDVQCRTMLPLPPAMLKQKLHLPLQKVLLLKPKKCWRISRAIHHWFLITSNIKKRNFASHRKNTSPNILKNFKSKATADCWIGASPKTSCHKTLGTTDALVTSDVEIDFITHCWLPRIKFNVRLCWPHN